MGGGLDQAMHNLIPASFAPQCGHAAPTQRQSVTGLGPTGDGERLWTVERRRFNIGTQGCLGKGNRYLAMNLRAVTLKEFVCSDMDDDIEIPCRPAVIAFFPFAGQAQARSIIDPSRDLHREFFWQFDDANATTLRTRVSDPHPLPTAGRTGGTQRKKPLPPFDLPEAAARVAGDRTCARRCALPQTVDTGFKLLKFQDFLRTEDRFLERQLHVIPQVGASPRGAATTAATSTEPKQFLKDPADTGKDVLKTTKPLETSILQPLVAVLVIETTLVRIMEHFVRLRRLLKFFLGFSVIRIAVWMVLKRQLAIAFFHLVFCGSPCYTEDVVIVPFGHSVISLSVSSLSASENVVLLP